MNRALQGQRLDVNMLRYQEASMMPANYQPPKVGHIAGPIKQKPAPGTYGSRSHHKTLHASREEKMAANALRTNLRQSDRVKKVLALYPRFDAALVAKVLGQSEAGVRYSIGQWRDFQFIQDSGQRNASGGVIWEAYDGNGAVGVPVGPSVRAPGVGVMAKWTVEQHRERCAGVFRGQSLDTSHVMQRMGMQTRRGASNQCNAWGKLGLIVKEGNFWREVV